MNTHLAQVEHWSYIRDAGSNPAWVHMDMDVEWAFENDIGIGIYICIDKCMNIEDKINDINDNKRI